MSYVVPEGSRCDDCTTILSDEEREVNERENREQDGNSLWCEKCSAVHKENDHDIL